MKRFLETLPARLAWRSFRCCRRPSRPPVHTSSEKCRQRRSGIIGGTDAYLHRMSTGISHRSHPSCQRFSSFETGRNANESGPHEYTKLPTDLSRVRNGDETIPNAVEIRELLEYGSRWNTRAVEDAGSLPLI